MIHPKASFNLNIKHVLHFGNDEIILFADSSVVSFKFDIKVPSFRNVCCLQSDNTIKWWIQDFAEYLKSKHPKLTDKEIEISWKFRTYTNIWEEEGKLKAFSYQGFDCTIDPATGQLCDIEFTK